MGRQIATSLLGADAVKARLGSVLEEDCGASWRASADNIRNLEYLAGTPLVLQGGPAIGIIVGKAIRDMRVAHARGKAFSNSITCSAAVSPPVATILSPSLMKGQLILLTDNLCFSSCLSVTDDFRSLGALHVGQPTDAATHFLEVREQYLPSGYSLFSTLESVDPTAPSQIGPFEPALTYNGDISDTAALEAWVRTYALHAGD
jgi:hypothetical protein